jgi:hypothetical protein
VPYQWLQRDPTVLCDTIHRWHSSRAVRSVSKVLEGLEVARVLFFPQGVSLFLSERIEVYLVMPKSAPPYFESCWLFSRQDQAKFYFLPLVFGQHLSTLHFPA